MGQKGINLEEVKKNNRAAILLALNSKGALSRKNIAEEVGLTQASVSIIVSEMINEGLLVELGELAEEEKRAGRKMILVDINATYKYVFCVGIESDVTYISLVDLKGNVIASEKIQTNRDAVAKDFITQICGYIKNIVWEQQIAKDKILAIGVSLPGVVDAEHGVSIKAYHVWDEEVPVRSIFEGELGIETLVENNVKAYALSEILYGNGKTGNDLFLLKWGPGVGSAVIINNQVYSGANGRAGEIGHMIAKRNGKLCSCGSRGCLETEVSSHAMNEADGDANLIDEKIDRFALTIRNAIRYLNPQNAVLWGYLFDNKEYYEKFVSSYKLYDPSVKDDFFVMSSLSAKDNHTEALAVIIDRYL